MTDVAFDIVALGAEADFPGFHAPSIGGISTGIGWVQANALAIRSHAALVIGKPPLLILISAALSQPLALARVARSLWPQAQLVFLTEPGAETTLRQQLGPVPLLGANWSVLPMNPPTLDSNVERLLTAARRRNRHKTTINDANRTLRSIRNESGTEHQRLDVLDGYLSNFLAFTRDAIVGLDAQQRIIFWSDTAQAMFGIERTQAHMMAPIYLPFWGPDLGDAVQASISSGQVSTIEHRLPSKNDEAVVQLEIVVTPVAGGQGLALGSSLVIRDVTRRDANRAVALEAAVVAKEATNRDLVRLRKLFKDAPGFTLITQGPRHIVQLANESFHDLLGVSVLAGQPLADAFTGLEAQPFLEMLDRVYASGHPYHGDGMSIRVPGTQGVEKERFLNFIFQPIFEFDGRLSSVFCQGHDVTAHVATEAALRSAQRSLEQALVAQAGDLHNARQALQQSQKLEAIGKLTGGVAHDFNNVLQVISANLQLVKKLVDGNEKATKRTGAAMEAVDRGAKLSGQLLAFARRQPLTPEATDLGRRLRAMDDLLRRALGESIDIEVSVGARLWTTLIDPNQFENVLLNLCINARDAMPAGGKLTLEASNTVLDEEYAASEAEVTAGQYVMLAISDTGTGMSAEVLEHAFDPFFTTKPEGQGTGLGLSMAYGFAKQSRGHIKLYSEAGHGTTVRLYLPRTLMAAAKTSVVVQEAIQGGTETILVAEDDLGVQATVVAVLEDLGYSVLRADDAAAALAILQTGVHVDLLFTDVVMPGSLRSTELVKLARDLLPSIAVLYTSGYTRNAIVHGGRLDPGVELLSKPYRQEQLARRVRSLLSANSP